MTNRSASTNLFSPIGSLHLVATVEAVKGNAPVIDRNKGMLSEAAPLLCQLAVRGSMVAQYAHWLRAYDGVKSSLLG
jgi:hypothetical protein